MEVENNFQDYFYYKFTPFNKIGEHMIAYELSSFYREYRRKELVDTVSKAIDNCLSGDLKLNLKNILTLGSSCTTKTTLLHSTISTNIEEFTKELKNSLKEELKINYGNNVFGLLSKCLCFRFKNACVELEVTEEIVTKDELKLRLNSILTRRRFHHSLEAICLEDRDLIALYDQNFRPIPEIIMNEDFENPFQRFLGDLNAIEQTLVYDGYTTSNYWGDPNLRNRQTSALEKLRKIKREMGLEN